MWYTPRRYHCTKFSFSFTIFFVVFLYHIWHRGMQKQRPFSVETALHSLWKSRQIFSCRRLQSTINFAQFFFSNPCLMRLLLLSTMETIARKLLTCYGIVFPCGNGASVNFLTNLRRHFLYQLLLRQVNLQRRRTNGSSLANGAIYNNG